VFFTRTTTNGIRNIKTELRQLKKTWSLVDDVPNGYDPRYFPLWKFLVKTISSTDEIEREVKVVIATTYALTAPDSPVVFEGIVHEQPDATQEEIFDLWELFAESLKVKDWGKYRDTLVDTSQINIKFGMKRKTSSKSAEDAASKRTNIGSCNDDDSSGSVRCDCELCSGRSFH